MSLIIGRATIDDPERITWSGDRVTLEGQVLASDAGSDVANASAYEAARLQLSGMVSNPDMDVWPVVWSESASLVGFFRVRRVEVDPSPLALEVGTANYRVELERATGLVAPIVESITSSVIMTNAAGVTSSSAKSVWAVPSTSLAVESPSKASSQPSQTRAADGDGSLALYRVAEGQSSASWVIDPINFWDASARVEGQMAAAVTTFYPLTSRAVKLDDQLYAWRLSNGLVRVQPTTTSSKLFKVSFYNGTSWCTAQDVQVYSQFPTTGPYNYQFSYDTVESAVILRNSPEVTTVRLVVRASTLAGGSDTWMTEAYATLDLSLRRGDFLVRCTLTPRGAYGYTTVGVGAASGTQATLTSGVRSNTVVNSGRILIGHVGASATGSLTYGNPGAYLYRYAVQKWCIGYELGGASASTYDAAQQVIYQYLASLSERARVVVR